MECRSSLFLPKEKRSTKSRLPSPARMLSRSRNTTPTRVRYNNNSSSSSTSSLELASQLKKSLGGVKEQITLPIPKNLVMMSLMELSSFSAPDGTILIEDDDGYDKREDDDAFVIGGIELLRGLSGTYIVREAKGLEIQPQNPRMILSLKSSVSLNTILSSQTPSVERFKQSRIVEYGQRVQIVNRVDGVYQLARNRGFITASDSQLVKVGPPLEESCRLEGMLHPLTKSKRILQEKLEKIAIAESKLNRQLSNQLNFPESYPIITNDTIDDDYNDDRTDELYCRGPVVNNSSNNNRNSRHVDVPQMDIVHKENHAHVKDVIAGDDDATRELQNPNFDFRTGLSGHLALQSARKLEKREPASNRSKLLMMSEHRGISTKGLNSVENSYVCSGIEMLLR